MCELDRIDRCKCFSQGRREPADEMREDDRQDAYPTLTGKMPIPLERQNANSEPNALAWVLEMFEAHHQSMIQRFVDS